MARAYITNGTLNVIFDVITSESVTRSSVVTDLTIEDGSDINDHIQFDPEIVAVSGRVTTDAPTMLNRLVSFFENRNILTYVGRNGVNTVVIESLDTDHPRENIGGFDFTMSLKRLRITTTQRIEIVVPRFTTITYPQRTAAPVNEGTKQKVAPRLDPQLALRTTEVTRRSPQLRRIDEFLRQRGYPNG